jgi:hypothetical protein
MSLIVSLMIEESILISLQLLLVLQSRIWIHDSDQRLLLRVLVHNRLILECLILMVLLLLLLLAIHDWILRLGLHLVLMGHRDLYLTHHLLLMLLLLLLLMWMLLREMIHRMHLRSHCFISHLLIVLATIHELWTIRVADFIWSLRRLLAIFIAVHFPSSLLKQAIQSSLNRIQLFFTAHHLLLNGSICKNSLSTYFILLQDIITWYIRPFPLRGKVRRLLRLKLLLWNQFFVIVGLWWLVPVNGWLLDGFEIHLSLGILNQEVLFICNVIDCFSPIVLLSND